jgi:hypothetical protein
MTNMNQYENRRVERYQGAGNFLDTQHISFLFRRFLSPYHVRILSRLSAPCSFFPRLCSGKCQNSIEADGEHSGYNPEEAAERPRKDAGRIEASRRNNRGGPPGRSNMNSKWKIS